MFLVNCSKNNREEVTQWCLGRQSRLPLPICSFWWAPAKLWLPSVQEAANYGIKIVKGHRKKHLFSRLIGGSGGDSHLVGAGVAVIWPERGDSHLLHRFVSFKLLDFSYRVFFVWQMLASVRESFRSAKDVRAAFWFCCDFSIFR